MIFKKSCGYVRRITHSHLETTWIHCEKKKTYSAQWNNIIFSGETFEGEHKSYGVDRVYLLVCSAFNWIFNFNIISFITWRSYIHQSQPSQKVQEKTTKRRGCPPFSWWLKWLWRYVIYDYFNTLIFENLMRMKFDAFSIYFGRYMYCDVEYSLLRCSSMKWMRVVGIICWDRNWMKCIQK